MPHNFRDISDIAGVAQPRSQSEQEMARAKARLWGAEGTGAAPSGNFAHPETNVAAMQFDPGMKIADFGAGSGAYTLAAARAVGRTGRVYAVDVQKDLLTRIKNNALREKLECVDIIWGDFEKLGGTNIKDKSLDAVIMSNVLFQLEHTPGAFAEAQRVLRPDGRLIIIDWADSFGGMGPEPRRVVTKAAALAMAQAEGFTLLREFPAGAHHYGLQLKGGAPAI
ncbi:MAG: methyltransferase domain-containing protein [Parcubacteria group bacterium]|nr:methyltransferase domain-containing protein [Parcubacteria group bacterium]